MLPYTTWHSDITSHCHVCVCDEVHMGNGTSRQKISQIRVLLVTAGLSAQHRDCKVSVKLYKSRVADDGHSKC